MPLPLSQNAARSALKPKPLRAVAVTDHWLLITSHLPGSLKMDKVRVGLVGCGGNGQAFVKNYMECPMS